MSKVELKTRENRPYPNRETTKVPKLRTIPEKCAACGICELACSYHHAKSFSRSLSSIEIHKLESTGKVQILILDAKDPSRKACDRCEDEKIPLCVKGCPVGAITVEAD